jgi:hypothetical protein
MMKKQILEAILEELGKGARAYQSDLLTLDTNINLDENASVGIDDISQKDQSADISNDMQARAVNLTNTINTVKVYQTISRNEFSPGALVETRDMYLLVGVSLPPLHVNNKKVIGITENAPIYSLLRGKKKGDNLHMGNTDSPILSVS